MNQAELIFNTLPRMVLDTEFGTITFIIARRGKDLLFFVERQAIEILNADRLAVFLNLNRNIASLLHDVDSFPHEVEFRFNDGSLLLFRLHEFYLDRRIALQEVIISHYK